LETRSVNHLRQFQTFLHGRRWQERRRHRLEPLPTSRLAPQVQCSPQKNWVEVLRKGNETKAGQEVLGRER